jgi:hypothetical protein
MRHTEESAMTDIFPIHPFLIPFIGADGDEEDEEGADGTAADTGQDGSDADGDDEAEEAKPEGRTYDAKYVKRLRNEAKVLREEFTAFKKQIANAGKSDDEKTKETEEQEQARVEALEGALRTKALKHATEMVAMTLDFATPSDAFALVDLSDIDVGEDYEPDRDEIKAELKKVLKSKPYLAKSQNLDIGDADGGATGSPKKPATQDAKVAAHKKAFVDSGMVPV